MRRLTRVTVRDFGESRLTGVLPRKATKIRVPESKAVCYDLLRGGVTSRLRRVSVSPGRRVRDAQHRPEHRAGSLVPKRSHRV